MTIELTLPAVLDLTWLSQGPVGGWQWARPAQDEDEVVRVRTRTPPVTWAEPVGLAMLAAWSRFQRTRAARAVIVEDSLRGPFTWQSGMLPALTGQPRAGSRVINFALQPTIFHTEGELSNVADCIEALSISDEATKQAAVQIIEDLARNVFHHASPQGGGAHVAARYDRQDQTLRIGVADCGKGIPRDIREHLCEQLEDRDAVAVAMEPEISGSAQPGINRGVGLYFVRRLALASRGALWLKTGRVVVNISQRTPDAIAVDPILDGAEWNGCAVGVMLRLGSLGDYQRTMETIRSDLDNKRAGAPRAQFYKRDAPDDRWSSIIIEPDSGVIATDRSRAHDLASRRIAPELQRGQSVSLDFTRARFATQAFCHALLVGICEQYGATTLGRIRFIGCANQVITVIRMALEYGLRQDSVPERPES